MECDSLMKKEKIGNLYILYADDGMTLTNGEVNSVEVWTESPNEWTEMEYKEEEIFENGNN